MPNPSFEELVFSVKPHDEDQLTSHCKEWRSGHRGTADYLYKNSVLYCTDFCGPLPVNGFGKQYPRTDEAYAGIGTFKPEPGMNFWRQEYLAVKLLAPLEAGMLYEVKFHMSQAERSTYGVEGLGAALLTDAAASVHLNSTQWPAPVISLTPDVVATGDIPKGADDDNLESSVWTEVSGQIIASGGEEWLFIGLFTDPPTTTTTAPCYDECLDAPCLPDILDLGHSYHYVDDVSVSQIYRETDPCPCMFDWQESIDNWNTPYDFFKIRSEWPSVVHPTESGVCCLKLYYEFSDIYKLHPGCSKQVKSIRVSAADPNGVGQTQFTGILADPPFVVGGGGSTIEHASSNYLPIDGEHQFVLVCGAVNYSGSTGFYFKIELLDEFGGVLCEKVTGREFRCENIFSKEADALPLNASSPTSQQFVFPNPTSGLTNVINLLHGELVKIEVHDMLGTLVHTLVLPSPVAEGQVVEIDLSALGSGAYILSLHGSEVSAKHILPVLIEK